MDIKIFPSKLNGSVAAISSKSDVHRLLISSALADKPTKVMFNAESKDIDATIDCLRSLGSEVGIEKTKDRITARVNPVIPVSGIPHLFCGECGSTARFLLPVSAALYESAVLDGKEGLRKRPFLKLCEVMRAHGSETDGEFLPIATKGKLKAGRYEIDGNISSQYITGLMFALSILKGESEIVLKSPLESSGYVDMTVETLERFGVKIRKSGNGYLISGKKKYISPGEVSAEGDWSNSAFWLVGGAVSGKAAVSGLNPESLQKDRSVMELLSLFGAKTERENGIYTSFQSTLSGIEIDASEIPDLVPVLAVAASAATGVTVIKNASRLRFKESDRLFTVFKCLNSLGADIRQTDDGLIIKGKRSLSGGITEGFGDHRIVMAAAIASLICENEVIIKGAEAVEKSYPEFFGHFTMLGGKISVM